MGDIYAVRIKERTGHQTNNEYWRVGSYLRFRPEIVEDNHGPGGFATYEPVALERASFGTKREALAIINFMRTTYAGVTCEIRRFVEAADAVA